MHTLQSISSPKNDSNGLFHTMRITIDIFSNNPLAISSPQPPQKPLKKPQEPADRNAARLSVSEDSFETEKGPKSKAFSDDEVIEMPREVCFEFLSSFIYAEREEFERFAQNVVLLEKDMQFIRRFLIKRIVSIKLKSEIAQKLTHNDPAIFVDRACELRAKVYYQRNSNCLRAVFRKIIEFMKHQKYCLPVVQLPNHNSLKSENYIRIVADLGILDPFEETILNPSFRSYLLTNSENCFRANFFRWAKVLSDNPNADIRMGIYPSDLDRALRDFESKLVIHRRSALDSRKEEATPQKE